MNISIKDLTMTFLVITSLFIASCNKKEYDITKPQNKETEKEQKPEEKVKEFLLKATVTENETASDFESGKNVSLFLRNEENELTNFTNAPGDKKENKIRLPEKGNSFVLFGCYPALESSDPENFQWNVSEHPNEKLLIATPVNVVSGQKITLSFKPVLHKLTVNLKGKNFEATEQSLIDNADIALKNVIPVAEFNLAEGKQKAIKGEKVELKRKGASVTFLIPEQPAKDLLIKVTLGGKEYEFNFAEIGSGLLESGKNTVKDLTIEKKKEEPEQGPKPEEDVKNKTLLISGVNIPALNDPKWEKIGGNPDMLGLKWTEGCGWYDCDKKNPNKGGIDSDMCWAAGASNMLHWWFDRNKAYIEKFEKEDNIKIPRKYENHLESEIFQLDRNNFPNKGNSPFTALNWFINGYKSTKQGAGYFKNIFGSDNSLVVVDGIGPENFAGVLIDAFKNNKCVGFTIYGSGIKYYHELTLWGAEFDKEGKPAFIYMVDSNDQEAFLMRKKLKYDGDRIYMEGSSPNSFSFYLCDYQLLSLGTEKWEAKYGKL